MADKTKLDSSTLKAFENAAAGHQGVLSDANGELIIKPCTQAEINFYQQTLLEHTEFSELIPVFMGTLQLGTTAQVADVTAASELLETAQSQPHQKHHGDKLSTETAIVLGNLEHGFKRPNVLDLKLGARLYDESTTAPEKAARLDKVTAETTSGSLNFRIAGMKVWNGKSFDLYDKYYGRKFNADNVKDGFSTFFSGLRSSLRNEEAAELLETIDAEIGKARHVLERSESRMYSASLLIVCEGDADAMETIMGGPPKTPKVREKAPKPDEVEQSKEEEEEEEDDPPVAFQVKMIDFAHAAWTPGRGRDENVIKGLKNIESQLDGLITQLTIT